MSKEELDSFEKEVLGESKFDIVFEEVDIDKLSIDGKNPNALTPALRAIHWRNDFKQRKA